jgi:hypothetical protein
MSLHSIRTSLLAFVSAILVAACGGSTTSNTPAPPVGGISVIAGDSQVTVSWKETPGVEYWIFAAPNNPSLTLGNWLATTGSTYRLKVTSPFVVTGLTNGTPYSFFMTGRVNSGPGGDATPTVTATPRLAGTTWTQGTNLNTGTKTGLTYGSYLETATNTTKFSYLAVGNGGRMYNATSADTWNALTPVVNTDLNAAEFGFAKFIAAGAAGKIIYSTDTKTWTQATSITTQNLNALAVNGSIAVAVGDNGTIITSKDGITWTAAASVPSSAHLNGVAYTVSGTWIAVGDAGTILTSPDGSTWSAQKSNNTASLKAVGALASVLNGTTSYQFIAVGTNGTVLSSPDAITWTAQNANTTASLNALSSVNQFLVVGSNGTIITSTDGLTWTRQSSNTNAELKSLVRAENQYLVVNTAGGIITSK